MNRADSIYDLEAERRMLNGGGWLSMPEHERRAWINLCNKVAFQNGQASNSSVSILDRRA